MKSMVVYKVLIGAGFGLAFIFGSMTVYLWSSGDSRNARIEQLEKEVAELRVKEKEWAAKEEKAKSKEDLNKIFFGGGKNVPQEDTSETFDSLFKK